MNRDIEFKRVIVLLNKFSSLFYAMVSLGEVVWNSILTKTAGVRYDRTGYALEWVFNPEFWDKLTDYQRAFIVAHECLHYILEHGIRLDLNDKVSNYAADMVVNQMLISEFGFEEDKLGDLANHLIWVETYLPDAGYGETVEVYYGMLKDLLGDQPDESINPIDDHSGLSGDGAGGGGLNQYPDNDPVPVEVGRGEINRDLEHNIGNLSEAEQEQIKRQLQQVCKRSSDTTSGSLAAGIEQQLVIKKVRPSRKWERVIKKWAKTKMKQTEQWVQVDRRWMYTDATIMVPSTHEQEDRGRIDVMFYMDASISCADEVARFLKAARSLPKDRFRVLLRSFDTTVYELDINEDKAEGFGGTAFAPLEAHALEQRKYPDAVFVLTDGIGDEITPMYPKRWHWFLTESGYEGLIDKRCNIHHLASYG